MKPTITNQPLLLGLVVILIIGGIFFLSNQKSTPNPTGSNPNLVSQVAQGNQKEGEDMIDYSIYPKAPEIEGIAHWINSEPRTISSLKGKVVLIDFWTYSCINCIRTLPYLNDWQKKYADKGLVIIGVHSPEFEFEKEVENVEQSIQKYGIQYPVALDNDFTTWRNYSNRYWPAKYLIDAQGRVRDYHFGEGNYDETEKKIQELLEEANQETIDVALSSPADAANVDFTQIKSPEMYFGYHFKRQKFGNQTSEAGGVTLTYTLPTTQLMENTIYLEGDWFGDTDHQRLESNEGQIVLWYYAKKVNLVLGSDEPTVIEVWIDGEKRSEITVQEEQLYELAAFETATRHKLELKVKKGLRAYAFTFG